MPDFTQAPVTQSQVRAFVRAVGSHCTMSVSFTDGEVALRYLDRDGMRCAYFTNDLYDAILTAKSIAAIERAARARRK